MIQLPYYIEDGSIGRVAEYNHSTHEIVVNPSMFYTLPELLQHFVLWHEFRHEDTGWNPDYARDEDREVQCDLYAVNKLIDMGYNPYDIIRLTSQWETLTEERREMVKQFTDYFHIKTSGFSKKRDALVWAEIYNVFGGKEGYDALPEPTKETIRTAVKDLDRKSNTWYDPRLQSEASKMAAGFANAVASGAPLIDVDDIQKEMEKTAEDNNVMYIIAAVVAVVILVFIVYLFKKKNII